MANESQEQYPDYPVFKGLQKPLEFMGLRVGTYIGLQEPLEEAF